MKLMNLTVPMVSTMAVMFGVLLMSACGGASATVSVPAAPEATVGRTAQAAPSVISPTSPGTNQTVSTTASTPSVSGGGETPIAPEMNLPGDIPDNQVFVPYTASDGYTLQVPEGWARTTVGVATTFTDKFNGLSVEATTATTAPPLRRHACRSYRYWKKPAGRYRCKRSSR